MYTSAVPKELFPFRHYAISTFGSDSSTWMIAHQGAIASAAWPLANLAIYVPFVVAQNLHRL